MKTKAGISAIKPVPLVFLFFTLLLSGHTSKNLFPNSNTNTDRDLNVVLITIDTLRYDRLSIYSDKFIKTPHIDRLGKNAIVFDNAFAHNPLTLPSHANILTGTYPLFHGIIDNVGFKLDPQFLTMAELLKDNGYQTGAFIGAFPLDSRFGLNQGFDLYDDNYGSQSEFKFLYVERIAENVIKPAKKWISIQKKKWFAWIHLFDPHQPYEPPPLFKKTYPNDPYSGEVAYVDSQLGIFFDFLREKKLLNKSIIIITSDHGEALGEKGEKTHGYFAYNNTIHIPLIFYDSRFESLRIKQNVSHIDIFPTLCDVLGIQVPPHVQGKSLVPMIKGREKKDRLVYFESLSPFLTMGGAPLRGIIKEKIKFIDIPIPEVYDIGKDRTETKNIEKNVQINELKSLLKKIIANNRNRSKTKRSSYVDEDTIKKMKSLGYITSRNPIIRKKDFTRKDDLKILLPVYDKTHRAVSIFNRGEIETSIKMLNEVIKSFPSYVMAYNNLAMIYKSLGKIDNAISILEQGLSKNPDDIRLLSKLGSILARSGKSRRGIEILEKCIKIEYFNPDLYNFLGMAYYNEKNLKKAIQNYNISLKLDRNNAPVHLNKGIVLLTKFFLKSDQESLLQGIQSFKMAIKFEPKLIKGYLLLAIAYKKNREINKAINTLKKGLKINPGDGSLLVELGIAYLDIGDNKNALQYFLDFKSKYFSRLPEKTKKELLHLIEKAKK